MAVSAVLSFVTACDGKPQITPSSSDLVGRVVKVSDGDTITVLDSSKNQHKIRLQGIDAPEKSQAYGDAAQRYLSGLIAGQEVRVAWNKRDKYNRILGTVYIKRTEVNLAMLRAGYAWHYKKFDSTPAYAQAESEASAARRGLWAGLDPIPPEQFRHGRARTPAAPPGGARRPAEPLGFPPVGAAFHRRPLPAESTSDFCMRFVTIFLQFTGFRKSDRNGKILRSGQIGKECPHEQGRAVRRKGHHGAH